MGFPSKNTGVGCHAVLQWIFPSRGSNPCLLHSREIFYSRTLLTYRLCAHFPRELRRCKLHLEKVNHLHEEQPGGTEVWLFVTPMDCSPPGSSVHGMFQARILEWVAISHSRGSSWSRYRAHVSCGCIGGWILSRRATREVFLCIRRTILTVFLSLHSGVPILPLRNPEMTFPLCRLRTLGFCPQSSLALLMAQLPRR